MVCGILAKPRTAEHTSSGTPRALSHHHRPLRAHSRAGNGSRCRTNIRQDWPELGSRRLEEPSEVQGRKD